MQRYPTMTQVLLGSRRSSRPKFIGFTDETNIQAVDLHRILIGTASNDEASGNSHLSYQKTVSNMIIEFQVTDT